MNGEGGKYLLMRKIKAYLLIVHKCCIRTGCAGDTQVRPGWSTKDAQKKQTDCLITSCLTAKLHVREVWGVHTFHVNSTNRLPAQWTLFGGCETLKYLYDMPVLTTSLCVVFSTTRRLQHTHRKKMFINILTLWALPSGFPMSRSYRSRFPQQV